MEVVESKSCKCEICGMEFPSKTKLFRHLSVHGFESKDAKPTKVVLLVGWLSHISVESNDWINEQAEESRGIDETSKTVEMAIFRALYLVENNVDEVPAGAITLERPKGYSRGSSNLQRTSLVFGSEASCHGQCDTICFHVKSFAVIGKDAWRIKMNSKLPPSITIHEVYELSPAAAPNFHAEFDCTQRRYEYILPLRHILPADVEVPSEPIVRRRRTHLHTNLPKTSRLAMDQRFPADTEEGQKRIAFFRKMKTIFKDLAGKKKFHNFVTGGAAPADSSVTRKLDRIYHKEILTIEGEDWVVFSISGDTLLKGQVRKLIGLTLAMALDIFPMEYVDVVFDNEGIAEIPSVPGWAMYLAECRYACWEAKYVEYKLDPRREESGNADVIDAWTEVVHRHIAGISKRVGDDWIKTYMDEAQSMKFRFESVRALKGRGRLGLEREFGLRFGEEALSHAQLVYEETEAVAAEIKASMQKKWEEEAERKKMNEGSKKELVNVTEVAFTAVDNELADIEMEHVSSEQQGPSGRTGNNVDYQKRVSRLCFINVPPERDDVPHIYARVLYLLREADRSQLWPSSSTGRQQVISNTTLLEVGGRGGSFSVGALPKHLVQPKGNIIFPELMKACFILERKLMPNRPPSATIAINRHAEFLPHRDSGAGAGQTKSLIVSLGAFSGGEIVVDYVPHDIRYCPLEFDGWQSLHYTLPFVGERYSLVWFTPLGLSYQDMWWWNEADMMQYR